jgi:hypothetical protein
MISNTFDNDLLKTAIREMNGLIKDNAEVFRLLFEMPSDSLEAKLYKNGITAYYIGRGFKIVNFPGFIYLDWSRADVYDVGIDSNATELEYLGSYFEAKDLYLVITGGDDLRSVSYQNLKSSIDSAIKDYNREPTKSATINVGIATATDPAVLNVMFAPELLKINMQPAYNNMLLSFSPGGLLTITFNTAPVFYTDIDYYILFGTRVI